MRIAFVTTWGRRCGLSVYAERLAAEWLAAGHEVWVLDEVQDVEALRTDVPNVNYIACWARPDPTMGVLTELVYIEPDICFFSHDWEGLSAEILQEFAEGCHELGFPLVVGWHNLVSYEHPAQKADAVDGHVVYHPDGVAIFTERGVDPSRVAYIPHGCGQPVHKPSPPRHKRARLATFGLMYPSKGLDNVVRALDEVRRRLPERNVTLDIYSSYNAWTLSSYKEHIEDVERLIRELGLTDVVSLWGGFPSEEGLIRALGEADALVLLYRPLPHRLSNSAALPTALATGVPVIVSDIAHFHGDAARNQTHLVAQQVDDAAAHIITLLTNDVQWTSLAEKASVYACNWRYADVAASYVNLFQHVSKSSVIEVRPIATSPRLGILIDGPPNIVPVSMPALRGYPVRYGLSEEASTFPKNVQYVLSLNSSDLLSCGWDIAVRTAMLERTAEIVLRSQSGIERVCRLRNYEFDKTREVTRIVLSSAFLQEPDPDNVALPYIPLVQEENEGQGPTVDTLPPKFSVGEIEAGTETLYERNNAPLIAASPFNVTRRLKALWIGEGPTLPTGFGRVTLEIPQRLYSDYDIDVTILALGEQPGNTLPYPHFGPKVVVHPDFSVTSSTLRDLIAAERPDVVITLGDLWNFEYMLNMIVAKDTPQWLGYFPVDAGPLPEMLRHTVRQMNLAITMSEFGASVFRNSFSAGDIAVVPLGVDSNVFRPSDADHSRRLQDGRRAFTVGCVARNQPRKNLPVLIEGFAKFRREHDDALLHLHTNPSDPAGWDLHHMLQRYGLTDCTTFTKAMLTFGSVTDSKLCRILQSFDVFALPTMGEGFGLPILEAMACGIPVVATNCSTVTELATGCGELISPAGKFYLPPYGFEFALASADAVCTALTSLYSNAELRSTYAKTARKNASLMSWDQSTRLFAGHIDNMMSSK